MWEIRRSFVFVFISSLWVFFGCGGFLRFVSKFVCFYFFRKKKYMMILLGYNLLRFLGNGWEGVGGGLGVGV